MKKINKYLFIFLQIIIFAIFLALPWHAPVFITSSINQQIEIELVKPNGNHFRQTFDLEAYIPFELRSVSVAQWTSPDNSKIEFVSHGKVIQNNQSFEPFSLRFTPSVLLSIFIVSFGLSALTYFIFNVFGNITKKELLIFASGFLSISLFLVFFMLDYAPGFYSIDMFYNYWDSSAFSISYFVGYLFSAFMIVGYQIFPSEFFIISSNLVFISFVLAGVLLFAYNRNLLKVFMLSLFLFFLYPNNIPMSLYGTRDIIAHWFLCGTMLYFYYLRLIETPSIHKKIIALILIFFCCFIRQENIYLLLPSLLLFSWMYFKDSLRIVGFFCFGIISIHLLLKTQKLNERIAYQTTLLVNPLSSVLVNKYGKSIPESVNNKLGGFYKNDYLVKHAGDDDIMSFHFGGINDNQNEESFLKFQKAALEIISDEPLLFLKNRWFVFKRSLGLISVSRYSFSQHYYDDQTPGSLLVKKKLGLKDHETGNRLAKKLHTITGEAPAYLVASYLIPILIILTTSVILGFRSLYFGFVCLLFIRTGMVFLTAPASYFKYHYILWLFALFSLPFALYERRTSLTKSTLGLKTQ